MRTLQSVQISNSNQDDGGQERRRSRSFLFVLRVSELAISELAMVVAILLIIIATAIPNLLLAGIADVNHLR
jgi:hypothetical protein